MSTIIVILCCAIPFVIIVFALLATSTRGRQRETFEAFAARLEGGKVIKGSFTKGPRAVGRWKGTEVSVGFFFRAEPPLLPLTAVSAAHRPSPFAALFLPREGGYIPPGPPPKDAPGWLVRLDSVINAGCAPRELFRSVVDEDTAALLASLPDTEVEVRPDSVIVQRREMLHDSAQIVPLLDAAVQLAHRLDGLQRQLVGPSDEEASRRLLEVREFMGSFRR